MTKRALITGITGQDGAYMAALLLGKGYEVIGAFRRSSSPNFWRTRALGCFDLIKLVPFDLGDSGSIDLAFEMAQPDECYNFASQSSVPISLVQPEYTTDVNAGGVVRMISSLKRIAPECRFYQASSSEMFGNEPSPQGDQTRFNPRSPYAVAKVAAHLAVIHNRDAYGLHLSNGIAFNHESPLRGQEFVTKKITTTLGHMKAGGDGPLVLGNIFSKRDWGFAGDYVEGMWKMLQLDKPADLVLCTGQSHSVQDFVEAACESIGFEIEWAGAGENTVGLDMDSGDVLVVIDPNLYRPTDVIDLCGDPGYTPALLKWLPQTSFKELAEMMAQLDLQEALAARLA